MTDVFDGPMDRSDVVARIDAHPVEGTPAQMRRGFRALTLGAAEETVEDRTSLHIPGTGGTIVYLHGGGYVFGSPATHARIGQKLAERSGWRVVLPAYPRAPEHPWPAQLDAALEAVADVDGPVILAGDSAGGHLALVTALELSRRGHRPAGLILFSPNTDRTGLSTTRRSNEPTDPMVDDEGDRQLARSTFGDRDTSDPQVSPLRDDLRLLPPVHLEVGGGEVLLDDSLLLAERARVAGVPVTLHVQSDGLHMMQLWTPWWHGAAASLDRAAAFVRTVRRADRTGGRGSDNATTAPTPTEKEDDHGG